MIQKEHIRLELVKFGQEHLLDFYDDLNDKQQEQLLKDIQNINLAEVTEAFNRSNPKNTTQEEAIDDLLEPLKADIHQSIARTTPEDLQRFRSIGKTFSV